MNGILAQSIGRLLILPTWAMAVAMLIKGYAEVGDGFSAGVIASLGPLVQLAAGGDRVEEQGSRGAKEQQAPPHRRSSAPLIAYSGLLLTLMVSFAPLIVGAAPVTHLPEPGKEVIHFGAVALHTALLFDLGIFLLIYGFITSVAYRLHERHKQQASPPGAT